MSFDKCEVPGFPSKIATNEQLMREVFDVFLPCKALQKSFSTGCIDVRQVILDAAMDEVMWTEVDSQDIPGPIIMAEQAWYPPVDPPNSKQ